MVGNVYSAELCYSPAAISKRYFSGRCGVTLMEAGRRGLSNHLMRAEWSSIWLGLVRVC